MTKNQFLTEAENYIKAIEGNYAPSTHSEKKRKLRAISYNMYHLFTEKKISSCNPRTMMASDINAYVIYRRSNGIMDTTIAKDLCLVADLFTFVKNQEMNIYRVTFGNKKPKTYLGKKDPLPDNVIDQIYEIARSTDRWPLLEGCMAAILGVSAGLRPQESKKLYISGVNHKSNPPTVYIEHVKGEGRWGRKRTVPLNDGVSDIYEKYLRMRQEKLDRAHMSSDAFFPPFRNDTEFVTQQSMSRFKGILVDELKKRYNYGGDFNFELRDGRRSYGQRMLDRDVPIEYVSYCMGHQSVETTQRFYADYREKKVLNKVCGILGQGEKQAI